MRKTDEIIERHTRQTWYGCEHCGAEHTVSERGGAQAAQRIGNAYRFSAMPMFPTPGRGSA
jgi:hypothetical protein